MVGIVTWRCGAEAGALEVEAPTGVFSGPVKWRQWGLEEGAGP